MRKKYNRVGYAVLTMCTALSISLPFTTHPASAESAADPAPEIKASVVNENNGKKSCLIIPMVKRRVQQIGLLTEVFLILGKGWLAAGLM